MAKTVAETIRDRIKNPKRPPTGPRWRPWALRASPRPAPVYARARPPR
ncbi:sulfide-quinone reductase domain protein [Mycobacterium xenopi 3993]|nr:sulfide-quinone reductase domain protein [Mycobacterium xenopi 3993]